MALGNLFKLVTQSIVSFWGARIQSWLPVSSCFGKNSCHLACHLYVSSGRHIRSWCYRTCETPLSSSRFPNMPECHQPWFRFNALRLGAGAAAPDAPTRGEFLKFISRAICNTSWLNADWPASNCAYGSPELPVFKPGIGWLIGGGGGVLAAGAGAGTGTRPWFSQRRLPEDIPKTFNFGSGDFSQIIFSSLSHHEDVWRISFFWDRCFQSSFLKGALRSLFFVLGRWPAGLCPVRDWNLQHLDAARGRASWFESVLPALVLLVSQFFFRRWIYPSGVTVVRFRICTDFRTGVGSWSWDVTCERTVGQMFFDGWISFW